MKLRHGFPLLILAALQLTGWPGMVQADTSVSAKEQELQQLRTAIRELKQKLGQDQDHYSTLEKQLQKTELRINTISRKLHRLKGRIKEQGDKLAELNRQEQALLVKVAGQREHLAEQIRASFAIGRQEHLKILLNQQSPATVARLMTYYDYLNRARTEQISAINHSLAELEELTKTISKEQDALKALQARRLTELEQFEEQRIERERVLVKLKQEISGNNSRLARMEDDEIELARLLKSLTEALSDIPNELESNRPFAKNRGKLYWPVQGRMLARYGARKPPSDNRWQGVLIQASEGDEVAAVSHGRVAYADWLRGYGLLMIIDHGDGYMSLYGHNQALYKDAGDWVNAGELIAIVGDSGGMTRSALYFELRKDGDPINPGKWCRARS